MKDYAKAFVYKYRRVYAILYIPTLLLMLVVYSALPYVRVRAQTTAGTDVVTELGFTDMNVTQNDYSIRVVDALHVELVFNNSNPEKKILFEAEMTERVNLSDKTFQYNATGRQCPGKILFNSDSKTVKVDIDFRPTPTATSTGGGCEDTVDDPSGVGVADPDNFMAFYRVVDKGTIERVDNDPSWIFKNKPADPLQFIRVTEDGQGCNDKLIAGGGDPPTEVTLFELNEGGISEDGSFYGDPPDWATAGNCKYRTVSNNGNAVPNNVTLNLVSTSLENWKKEAGTGSTSSALNGDENPTCETSGGLSNPLSWVICPIFNMLVDAIDAMFRIFIDPLMRFNPIDANNENDITVQIWSSFRGIANIMLVIMFIIAIFGQSIGGGIIDAYTAKKMLPRLLLAAVFVNLSIYFVAIMVDITNVLGGGIGQLLTAPLNGKGNFHFTLTAQDTAVAGTTGFIGGGLAALGFLATLFSGAGSGSILGKLSGIGAIISKVWTFFMIPALIISLAIVATLVIRRGLILLLAIVAPIAGALYVLPSTEKYFKTWWETFFKTLLVYPIISAIFATADILFVTLRGANTGGLSGLVASAASFVILFVPLALVPFAFKLAGGVMGNIYNLAKSGSDKARARYGGDERDPMSRRARAKERYEAARIQGRKNIAKHTSDKLTGKMAEWGGSKQDPNAGYIRRGAGRAGRRLAKSKSAQLAAARIVDAALLTDRAQLDWDEAMLNKSKKDIANELKSNGNDRMLRGSFTQMATQEDVDAVQRGESEGIGGNKDIKAGHWYSWVNGAEFSAGDVAAAKNYQQGSQAAGQAALAYEYSKASDQDMARLSRERPMGEWMEDLGYNTKSKMDNVLIGAGFAVQGQRREAKHFRGDVDENGRLILKLNGSNLLKELPEKLSPFASGNLDASTPRVAGDLFDSAVEIEKGMGYMTAELRDIATDATLSDEEKLARMDSLATTRLQGLTVGTAPHAAAAKLQSTIQRLRKNDDHQPASFRLDRLKNTLNTQQHIVDLDNAKSWADGMVNNMNKTGQYGEVDGVPINASSSGGAGRTAEAIESVVARTRAREGTVIARLYGSEGGSGSGGRGSVTTLPGGTPIDNGGAGGGTVLMPPGGGPTPPPSPRPGPRTLFAPSELRPTFTRANFVQGKDSNGRPISLAEVASTVDPDVKKDEHYDPLTIDYSKTKPEERFRFAKPKIIGGTYAGRDNVAQVFETVARLGNVTQPPGRSYTAEQARQALEKLPSDVIARLQSSAVMPYDEIRLMAANVLNNRRDSLERAGITADNTTITTKGNTGRGQSTTVEVGEVILPSSGTNATRTNVTVTGAGSTAPAQSRPDSLRMQELRELAAKEIYDARSRAPRSTRQIRTEGVQLALRDLAHASGRSRGDANATYRLEDLKVKDSQGRESFRFGSLPDTYLRQFSEATANASQLGNLTPQEKAIFNEINQGLALEAKRRQDAAVERERRKVYPA